MTGPRYLTGGGSAVLVVALTVALAGVGTGCRGKSSGESLGLPDAYLLFVPQAAGKGDSARRGPSGLPILEPLALDDSRAVPYHKLFAVGFAAELLRTDYLRKQFVREAQLDGRRFPPEAVAAASQPTIFVLAGDPPFVPPGEGRGIATLGFFGGASEHPNAAWIALPPLPETDLALPQTVSARLGHSIAAAIAAGGGVAHGAGPSESNSAGVGGPVVLGAAGVLGAAAVLIDGYAAAMSVIAREWRVGDGPRGTLPPDVGTEAQRALFAGVRQNRFVMSPAGTGSPQLRSAADMLADPGVAATVIYRMAQAKGIGHRVAPPEVYTPFTSDRVPAGVSPAAVLGPIRNFQAKLITAWGRAVMRGTPPHDIVDLVAAYGASLPAERADVIRLFVVTTFGATVKPGGVAIDGDGSKALAELTALAAEVAAGRRPLRLP